jgi:FkbM family methyltransferase
MFSKTIRFIAGHLPPRLPEIVYTVLLRPKPLRHLANRILLKLIPARVKVDGLTLYLNPRDPVLSSALAFGIYENHEADLFRRYCKEGATVVDIGANVGLYTVIAAARVGRAGRVIALEPHLESFQYLEKTIVANGLTQVRSFNLAAGESVRDVPLFLTDDNKADSRIYSSDARRQKVVVQMVDLDHLLKENGIDKVDVIKMDIQGAEALALRGMSQVLANNPELVIFTEFWPWGMEQAGSSAIGFLQQLRDVGFSFHAIDEENRTLTSVDTMDELVAMHRDLQYTGADLRRSHANLICSRQIKPSMELQPAGLGTTHN